MLGRIHIVLLCMQVLASRSEIINIVFMKNPFINVFKDKKIFFTEIKYNTKILTKPF